MFLVLITLPSPLSKLKVMEKRLHNVKRILNFREDVAGCFCSQLEHKFPSYFASHHLYVIEVKQIINFNHVFNAPV